MRRVIFSTALLTAALSLGSLAFAQEPASSPGRPSLLRSGPQMYSVPGPAPAPALLARPTLTSAPYPEPRDLYQLMDARWPGQTLSADAYVFLYGKHHSIQEQLPGEARLSPYATRPYRVYDPYAQVSGTAPRMIFTNPR